MTHPKDLLEGLVISFSYEEADAVFRLVSEVPFASMKGSRVFAELKCKEVESFVRRTPDPRWAKYHSSFSARELRAAFVLQSISEKQDAGACVFDIDFGPNLGGVEVRCNSYDLLTREATAEQRCSDWEYRDSQTGEVVDFYSPFR